MIKMSEKGEFFKIPIFDPTPPPPRKKQTKPKNLKKKLFLDFYHTVKSKTHLLFQKDNI